MRQGMASAESIARAVRLARIPFYLQSHPKGLTTRELADLCGVCSRTMQRDLNALQLDLKLPLVQQKNRYLLSGDFSLPPVSLSLYESVALFLATRLLLRQVDKSNPHLETALAKIASSLPSPVAEQVKQGIADLRSRRKDTGYIRIYEQLALAWTTRRKVRLRYRSLQSSEFRDWLLEPYYLEMTGVGFSSYVIGHAVREGKEGILTFKLDRIQRARLTDDHFDIPEDLDIGRLLSSSWGVVWGEDVEVVLKFSPRVTRRVRESIWHPSQVISRLPGGGCLMKLKIGSLMEITPWIRSWGPDVEVLAPESLRRDFSQYAAELHRIYNSEERSG